jgi:GNAT superfamily N-acetyltransferase
MTASIRIFPSEDPDIRPIMELVVAAHWPHRPEDVKAAMDLGRVWLAQGDAPGGIAGMAVWWAYGAAAARIGLVIVSPDYQGQGIGRQLVERILDEGGPRGWMLLSTEAGRSLYQKLGFRILGSAQRHQGIYRHESVTDSRIRMASADDYARLMKLDHSAIGADRGPILRHLFEHGQTVILSDSGRAIGFAVARRFGLGLVVGPIVAPSERDAIALFKASARPGFVRVDRPMEATRLGQHLDACGLEGDEVSDVMVLGEWPAESESVQAFAMAGHAWG